MWSNNVTPFRFPNENMSIQGIACCFLTESQLLKRLFLMDGENSQTGAFFGIRPKKQAFLRRGPIANRHGKIELTIHAKQYL